LTPHAESGPLLDIMLRQFPLLIVASVAFAFSAPASALTISEIGADGAPGEDGETVSASGVETAAGADSVELQVSASGGDGGPATDEGEPAGHGGGASLGEVFGASGTGPVSVSGSASGGNGGTGSAEAAAGDGASVELWNAVDGETQGRLTLSQTAMGGDVGALTGGVAGSARSVLWRRKSAESLELHSLAVAGGPRLWSHSAHDLGGDGATARAEGHAANDAGEVASIVYALAGSGGAPDLEAAAAPGGDAQVVAIATSEGDGQQVIVGGYPPASAPYNGIQDEPIRDFAVLEAASERSASFAASELPQRPRVPVFISFARGARAGTGGSFNLYSAEPTPPGGRGGAARSFSLGIAHGDSPVKVLDEAIGGPGGSQANFSGPAASRGGPAESKAIGLNRGVSDVSVNAEAAGGAAGTVWIGLGENSYPYLPPDPSPFDPDFALPGAVPGGAAEASALAIGGGDVIAQARAQGGSGTLVSLHPGRVPRHPGAQGHARATAVGASGEAEAAAVSNTPTLRVELRAGSSVVQMATADSRIAPGALRGKHGRRRHGGAHDASAQASVAPDEAALDRALASDPALSETLEVVVLGRLAASQQQRTRRGSVVSTLEVELKSFFFSDPVDEVFIALFAPDVRRRGFERLRVHLTKEDEILVDEVFETASDARDFLEGALFEVGSLGLVFEGTLGRIGRSEVATLTLELETRRRGAGLDVGFVVGTTLLPAFSQP